MAVWLVVLVLTNALTLGWIYLRWRRDHRTSGEVDEVFTAPRPAGVTTRTRHLITIEVLNPIELVGARGRVAGLAGSLAPGIARRFVYDRVLKTLRRELADKQVLADVQLHQLHRVDRPVSGIEVTGFKAPELDAIPEAVDEVSEIDLDEL